jgi:hypothetical protein
MKLTQMLAAAALTLFLPPVSLAHDMVKGPNGGPVVEAAGHHVEFVNEGADLSFFLSDEAGKPIESKGANGRAVIQDHGKTETVPLASADPNKLTANAPQPLGAGARVVLSATLPDGHPIQARFVKN